MSISKRKVKFYSLQFWNKKDKKPQLENPIEKLRNFVTYFNNLADIDKKQNLPNNKFCFLKEFKEDNDGYFKGYFISAKTHHKPPLIDEETLRNRENPKELTEGEEEKTHFIIKVVPEEKEAILLLEDRKVGISISVFKKYFNSKKPEQKTFIKTESIIKKDFLQRIDNLKRITIGTLYIDKQILGSEYMNFAAPEDSIREEVELIIKPKRQKSLSKQLAKNFVRQVMGTSSQIKRIKLQGQDEDKNIFTIDTDNAQVINYVEVELEELTKVVVTNDMYDKMISVMENEDV